MSEYGYDDRPRRRARDPNQDRYATGTTYVQRGPGQPSRELVYRGREDSIEDIPRDFPPPGAAYRRTKEREYHDPPRRARSAGRRDRYDDNDYSEYAAPAGAAAGYAAARSRRGRGRRDDESYYSDDYERPRRERRKSGVGGILEDLGLGGVAGALIGGNRSRSRSRRRHRDSSSDSGRSHRSRRGSRGANDTRQKWQQAAKAAVLAGAVEAFRSRNEAGPWTGAKGQRVATAALGAAGIDGLLDRDPDKNSKRNIVEGALGGVAASYLANGPREKPGERGRSQSRGRSDSRGRSRSRSVFDRFRSRSRGGEGAGGSGLKDVAALSGVAAVGKAIYDRVRSKSRNRRRSPSSSSADSYVPSRRNRYQQNRGGPPAGEEDDDRVARPRGAGAERRNQQQDKRDSSEGSVSTTDMEIQRKHMRGKELVTAGLAAVATIHAAHGVYSSIVASEKRHKQVEEGEISPEEARKRKSKNRLQDVAAVGIAALGIKSAFSEWKEMNEQRNTIHELEEKRRKRRKAKEKKEREARLNGLNGANPYLIYPAPVPMPMPPYGQQVYADGNPYAVGNLPPPPMGVQPSYR